MQMALTNEKAHSMTNSRNTLENGKCRNLLISDCISGLQVYRGMMFYVVFENASLEVMW